MSASVVVRVVAWWSSSSCRLRAAPSLRVAPEARGRGVERGRVVGVRDSVVVVVSVAGVASVRRAVGVGLVAVRDGGAVVGGVGDRVAVGVRARDGDRDVVEGERRRRPSPGMSKSLQRSQISRARRDGHGDVAAGDEAVRDQVAVQPPPGAPGLGVEKSSAGSAVHVPLSSRVAFRL